MSNKGTLHAEEIEVSRDSKRFRKKGEGRNGNRGRDRGMNEKNQ